MSNNEMRVRMTVSEALEYADQWTQGQTFNAGSEGWRVVCAVLAAEVRRGALTDEQVREIAEKWSRAWMQDKEIKHVEAMESAIREAMGRGERG